MDIASRLALSYYKEIAALNEEHNIYVVQNTSNRHIFVRKILDVYNKNVYHSLKDLSLPGMPHIYEIFEADGRLVIIEEYIAGSTLEELLNENYPFTPELVTSVLLQLCETLQALHNCQPPIIHRDIKPSNVILKPDGRAVLLDFNAARRLSAGKVEDTKLLGTKGYAAPEQYGFGTSDARTDIYALGMLANTLLNGGFSPVCTGHTALAPVIQKCIRLNPEERYQNVGELQKGLKLRKKSNLQEAAPSRRDLRRYLPPGFRSGNPIYMIVSALCYGFIFWLCLTLEIKDAAPPELWVERLFCLFTFMGTIFLSCNYCGIQSLFPPCRTQNRFLKFCSVLLLDGIFISLALGVMGLIASIVTW
ncbi:MAG: serine/threonine protein kinase [Butyrivibrio sp.]|nr:serine/threonine protein kinase [Acetatifactor muris]MCM1559126.1 serine/threonine protein kinase [Butyrivibrio sp.]